MAKAMMHATIRKHTPRVFIFKMPGDAAQQAAQSIALQKLKGYLDAEEPKVCRWLYDTWNAQAEAIKYQELRDAIIAGDLSLEYLKQWQQDYAHLVNTKLSPQWIDAMEVATEQLHAKYPEWVFDPAWPATQRWVEEHGAQLAVNLTQVQHEALKHVIQRAAFMGELGPDELSRCIRPLVGMVPREAAAVLNYYKAMRDDGMGIKDAQRRAANYAGRVHRHRAMRIARTELAFAFNNGMDQGIQQAQLEGYIGVVRKRWLTADDERVCEICGPLDMQIVDQEASFQIPLPEKYVGMHRIPPAHPHCRCTVIYEEVEAPHQQPGTQVTEEELEAMQQAMEQEERPAHAPGKPQVPGEDELTYLKSGKDLGGAGKKDIYVDKDGNEWLFKPAETKGGAPAEYKAYAQEAASQVQTIVDGDTAVQTGTVIINGKTGTIQRIVHQKTPADLKAWQAATDDLPQLTVEQLQREHVTDWLIGNFDAHGGNFVFDEQGRLLGVDKEQAFRYIDDVGSWKMSITYHPNSYYGETEPIYNTLYRRFAEGTIDMDLQEVLPYIKRVEAIPTAEYREMFRAYAESLHGKGKKAEQLLDQIAQRKGSLRDTYREFYGELLTQRTGKKIKFIFADEGAEANNQPLAAQLMSKDALKKMKTSELMAIAKGKKIPYCNNMNKAELITSLAEPENATLMSAKVRDRLKAAELAREGRAGQQAARTAATAVDLDNMDAGKLFKDFSAIPKEKIHGVAVASDTTAVEGIQYTARKISIEGQDYYEISGKLTEDTWRKVKNIPISGRSQSSFVYRTSTIDYDKKEIEYTGNTISMRSRTDESVTYKYKNVQIDIFTDDSQRGLMGTFRIQVKDLGGEKAAQQVREALDKLNLQDLATAPPEEAVDFMKKMRVLWQQAPAEAAKISVQQGLTAAAQKQADDALKRAGISLKDLNRLTEKEVFQGYRTYVDDKIVNEYKKLGAEYLYHGIPRAENVVKVLKSEGLMATNERYRMGIAIDGASSARDMETGGSDSIFLRLVTRNAKGKFNFGDAFYGDGYRITIDINQLGRTDWYGYTSDEYGTTRGSIFNFRESAKSLIERLEDRYRERNELMFRKGIPKEAFTGITCDTQSMKYDLISILRREGITRINGKSLEDFIRVQEKL